MGKQKSGYYAVRTGRVPGIYSSWSATEEQVKGFAGAEHKKFSTEEEARSYLDPVQYAAGSNDALKVPTAAPYPKPTFDERQKLKRTQLTSVTECHAYEPRTLVVHTDGACPKNGQRGARAGIGVWYGPDDPRNIADVCPGSPTNNRAELYAIIRALEKAQKDVETLIIKTDSKYCIGCFTSWHKKWERHGWKTSKGEPVGNKGMIRLALAMLSLRSLRGEHVKIVHVRGHSGDPGNEGADYLARMGATGAIVDDYDWDMMREAVEREIQNLPQRRRTAVAREDFQVLLEDLWTEEELEELEANDFA